MVSTATSIIAVRSVIFILIHLVTFVTSARRLDWCRIHRIYQLGDSNADTGNLIRLTTSSPCARLPYGVTFSRRPTGRCSDGLLMIDYIAKATGHTSPNPFLKKEAYFDNGVNFAVAGGTALTFESLAKKNITNPITTFSLQDQLFWMRSYLQPLCHSQKRCSRKHEASLFIVGVIGGNDYNYALFQGKSVQELKMSLVAEVIAAIIDATQEMIRLGASRIIVPGIFPIGCFPVYLTGFKSNDSATYDDLHCLKSLNEFSIYHNTKLRDAIEELSGKNPEITILYADYYNAFMRFFQNAPSFGFEEAALRKSCCGEGGEYNFSLKRTCGLAGVSVCATPNRHVSWDGIHLTQAANMAMANWLMANMTMKLHCEST